MALPGERLFHCGIVTSFGAQPAGSDTFQFDRGRAILSEREGTRSEEVGEAGIGNSFKTEEYSARLFDQVLNDDGGSAIMYEQSDARERMLIALNFGDNHEIVDLPRNGGHMVLISIVLDRSGTELVSEVPRRPGEGVLLRSD